MIAPILITAAHLACLSQLETGDDDFAVGSHGEVSRYQVMPKIWFDKAGTQSPRDPKISFVVAKKLWQARVNAFVKREERNPTIEELPLLWHCPSHALDPDDEEKDYATRFFNLMERHASQTPKDTKTNPSR